MDLYKELENAIRKLDEIKKKYQNIKKEKIEAENEIERIKKLLDTNSDTLIKVNVIKDLDALNFSNFEYINTRYGQEELGIFKLIKPKEAFKEMLENCNTDRAIATKIRNIKIFTDINSGKNIDEVALENEVTTSIVKNVKRDMILRLSLSRNFDNFYEKVKD